ncbi:MAG: TerB family tellurite resistance protein, partial [Pseudomonadota bacterium]
IVYSDGQLHELEDNVVWRIAELLGVSARDRMLAKQDAVRDAQ